MKGCISKLKRFVFNGDINCLKKESFDVVIIGSGIAGLYTALNIDENLSVAVLSKESSMVCSSWACTGRNSRCYQAF
jgi:L-aspartate oxidase